MRITLLLVFFLAFYVRSFAASDQISRLKEISRVSVTSDYRVSIVYADGVVIVELEELSEEFLKLWNIEKKTTIQERSNAFEQAQRQAAENLAKIQSQPKSMATIIRDAFKFREVTQMRAVPQDALGPLIAIAVTPYGKKSEFFEGDGVKIGEINAGSIELMNSITPIEWVGLAIDKNDKVHVCFYCGKFIVLLSNTDESVKRIASRFLEISSLGENSQIVKVLLR